MINKGPQKTLNLNYRTCKSSKVSPTCKVFWVDICNSKAIAALGLRIWRGASLEHPKHWSRMQGHQTSCLHHRQKQRDKNKTRWMSPLTVWILLFSMMIFMLRLSKFLEAMSKKTGASPHIWDDADIWLPLISGWRQMLTSMIYKVLAISISERARSEF